MQTLSDALAAARLGLRHRQGCYRWTPDGRCVDCRRYTGTPHDVVECKIDGESQYYDERRMTDRLLRAQVMDRPHAAPKMAERRRGRARPLTEDQLVTREAWRQWRAAQGDPNPDLPRSRRDRG